MVDDERQPDSRTRPAVRSAAERDALVRQYLGIPPYVVNRFYHLARQYGVCPDDAEQEGFIALIRAAELWEETRGVSFKTYAVNAVINRLVGYCTGNRLVHVPRRPPPHYAGHAARALTVRDIADCGDCLAVPEPVDRPEPDEFARLRDAVRRLPARQRDVIAMRYEEGQTLQQIADRLGRTRERVRQIQQRAIRTLRGLLGVGVAA